MWLRTKGYFKRSRWAGKRSLDGTDVVDGVATNALAHAVATGLHMAGAHTIADVASVETDLYRAHNTQSDDTSVIRVRTAAGRTLLCALTLCAPEQQHPSVTVHGTLGDITFFYTEDECVPPRRPASAAKRSGGPTCWRTCLRPGPPALPCCAPWLIPARSPLYWRPSGRPRTRWRSAPITSPGRATATTPTLWSTASLS